MPDLVPLELRALAKIMHELDYYQMLHLDRSASSSELKRAYYATSRTFHPDANRHLDEGQGADCSRISKRVTEAYCVLRDPRRRKAYDELLEAGTGVRMQLAEAKAAHDKHDIETRLGRTPQGRQFFQAALQDLEKGDHASARRNVQMAITFEPNNDLFKERLAAIPKS